MFADQLVHSGVSSGKVSARWSTALSKGARASPESRSLAAASAEEPEDHGFANAD